MVNLWLTYFRSVLAWRAAFWHLSILSFASRVQAIGKVAGASRSGGNAEFRGRGVRREGIMIRSELLQELHKDNPDLRAEEIEQVVDVFFDEIAQRLAEGGRVELRGFGAFSTRERDARVGRNPRTGEAVNVPAKRVPYFKAGKEIRKRLND